MSWLRDRASQSNSRVLECLGVVMWRVTKLSENSAMIVTSCTGASTSTSKCSTSDALLSGWQRVLFSSKCSGES